MQDDLNKEQQPAEPLQDKSEPVKEPAASGAAETDSVSSADVKQPEPQASPVEQPNVQQNYGYPYGSGNPAGAPPQQPPYAQQNGYYGANPNYVYYGAPQKPKKQIEKNSKHKKNGLRIFFGAVAACLVLAVIGLSVALVKGNNVQKTTTSGDSASVNIAESPTASSTGTDGELTAKGVYEKVKESSVGVLVYSGNGFSNTSLAGEGSGVIVGEDTTGKYTYIVTCAHVISDGGTIKVQLYDETQYDATVVGYDSRTDIGVLRITATGLKAAELGDSDSLSVGETVYAIGNPGGVAFAGSFTNGIVSAISRPVDSEIGYEMLCIQHTAAINPGNSGGALVNAYGQVIGINSSKIASTDYEGMGFAVPSVTVKEVFDEIVANGYVTNRPKLGITYFPVSSNQMYSMIAGVNKLPAGTIIIQSISSDSPLADTDVQQGDMIIKANGKELESADTLPDLIENANVGDEMTLTIARVDMQNNYTLSQFDVKVTLVEDKGTTTATAEPTTSSSYYNPFGAYGYGN